jgi:hypothetical protein
MQISPASAAPSKTFRWARAHIQRGTERDRQSERERCLNTHASTIRRPQHRRTQTLGPLLFLGVARPGADRRHFEALAAALAGRQPRTPRRQQAAGTHLPCSSHTQGYTERVRETRAHVHAHTHTHTLLNTAACTSICAPLLFFSFSLCLLSLSLSLYPPRSLRLLCCLRPRQQGTVCNEAHVMRAGGLAQGAKVDEIQGRAHTEPEAHLTARVCLFVCASVCLFL